MKKYIFLVILYSLLEENKCSEAKEIVVYQLNRTLTFIEEKFEKFGFDGTFGITLAQVQLKKILIHDRHAPADPHVDPIIETLDKKCDTIVKKMMSFTPIEPSYMITFRKKLLDAKKWTEVLNDEFSAGDIAELGIYNNWTANIILKQKRAIYKGVKSDTCLREILEHSPSEGSCFVSDVCSDMMLDWDRIDAGYLLTHRLLYLQVKRLQGCTIPNDVPSTKKYSQKFCSYIFKEARTNQMLGFPYHDIFLEQVVLCGMEGYGEFLNARWLSEILHWQNSRGCFSSVGKNNRNKSKRTSTTIDYGCSDHSTGLGAAALAIFLRYLRTSNNNILV